MIRGVILGGREKVRFVFPNRGEITHDAVLGDVEPSGTSGTRPPRPRPGGNIDFRLELGKTSIG